MCRLLRRYDSYEEYQHERLKMEEYRRDYEKQECERAEQRERQRQKAVVSQLTELSSHFLYWPFFFFLWVVGREKGGGLMLDFGSSCNKADKRPHVITAMAQHTKTSHRHAQITWDDTACSPVPCATVSLSTERIHTKWVPEWFRRQALPLYLWVVYF